MKLLVGVKRVIDYAQTVRVAPDNLGVVLQNMKMSMNPFCEIAVEESIRLKEKNIASEVQTSLCYASLSCFYRCFAGYCCFYRPQSSPGNAPNCSRFVTVLFAPFFDAKSTPFCSHPTSLFLSPCSLTLFTFPFCCFLLPAMGADRANHVNTSLRPDQEMSPLLTAKVFQQLVERETPDMVLMGKQSIDGDFNQTAQMLSGMLNWSLGTFLAGSYTLSSLLSLFLLFICASIKPGRVGCV